MLLPHPPKPNTNTPIQSGLSENSTAMHNSETFCHNIFKISKKVLTNLEDYGIIDMLSYWGVAKW